MPGTKQPSNQATKQATNQPANQSSSKSNQPAILLFCAHPAATAKSSCLFFVLHCVLLLPLSLLLTKIKQESTHRIAHSSFVRYFGCSYLVELV